MAFREQDLMPLFAIELSMRGPLHLAAPPLYAPLMSSQQQGDLWNLLDVVKEEVSLMAWE